MLKSVWNKLFSPHKLDDSLPPPQCAVDFYQMPYFFADGVGSDSGEKHSVKVMQFNVLAQTYSDFFLENVADSKHLSKEHRSALILKLLDAIDPDIFCWQEVDVDLWKLLEPKLKKKYKVIGNQRPGGKLDGIVTGFLHSRFEEKSRNILSFDEMAKNSGHSKDRDFLTRHIAQVTTLFDRAANRMLTVYNAFLYWNPARDDVKYYQIACVFEWIARNHRAAHNILLLGDLNSKPNSNGFRLLAGLEPLEENIEVLDGRPQRLQTCTEIFKLADLQSLKLQNLQNAYAHYRSFEKRNRPPPSEAMDEEPVQPASSFPPFSNYTKNFKETIDHIFFSGSLELLALRSMPDVRDMADIVALPNQMFPSDHLPLVAVFRYRA